MTKQASTELAQETTGKGRLSGATEFSPVSRRLGPSQSLMIVIVST